jgi:hypothetical protein
MQLRQRSLFQSGAMAVTTGHYAMRIQGPAGPGEDKGKYEASQHSPIP